MSLFRLGAVIGMATPGNTGWRNDITAVDVYDLDDAQGRSRILSGDALIISGNTDHVLLAKHREALSDFVREGGRVLVNGQVTVAFIDGLSRWSKLEFRNAADVRPQPVSPHAVFDGVDYQDLHYRTGVPGTHSYADLERIGVAGFYGRGYHATLPAGAQVVSGIGPLLLPLDYSYQLGAGEVLVHGGLDLEGFADEKYSSRNLGPNLVAWLSGGPKNNTSSAAHERVNA